MIADAQVHDGQNSTGSDNKITRLLVIEDEAPLLKTILNSLRFEGYEAIGALDGAVGVEMARSHQPDLVISDIRMPKLDGYGVLQALRSDPEMADMPIIFLTAKSARDDFRYGMALGADDYVSKPFTFEELLAAIEARLARHARHQATQDQLNEVSQSDQLKSDMMLLAAHDLRNPITSIRIALHTLKRRHANNVFSEDDIHELNRIAAAALRMEAISADILSLERIDAVARDDTIQPIVLNDLVESCCQDMREQAAEKGLEIKRDIAADEIVVLADTVQLQEAIYNLLDNAIKYSHEAGHITVRLDHVGENCLFIVEDTGYGIPDDQLDQVFQPFYRAEAAEMLMADGHGVGLHLVKRIVERHQGEVFVESVYGQGSLFGFFLPIYDLTPDSAQSKQAGALLPSPDTVLRLISHIIGL